MAGSTDCFRSGAVIGFNYARRNPDLPLEKLLADIDSLMDQARLRPVKELEAILAATKE